MLAITGSSNMEISGLKDLVGLDGMHGHSFAHGLSERPLLDALELDGMGSTSCKWGAMLCC